MSGDSDTWGDQSNWSAVTTLTDHNGGALIQGNSFVALRNGLYYMAFDDMDEGVYFLRTLADLTSGWTEAVKLDIESGVHRGDSENLIFLSDGTMRFYISNGNSLKHVMWYVDSKDFGVTWTSPEPLWFAGFNSPGINWAQVVRVTDPTAIANLVDAHLPAIMNFVQER